ncbi:hypothetical protein LOC68_09000 [Blastopirellula sp. JC732]|uniref:Uncharacterized protein n=1 Tax=Blastopirellula sediminis TaxID=2894196 RepID=A0A9X1MLI3_9BACT|nr:hypothetical protein [Blastopirellula sediminis]MCC9608691.1 hypothetical protein [Blastopirellula sediminis]MCC9628532.1 hypothetical protein [Blastopirellula sediminis]
MAATNVQYETNQGPVDLRRRWIRLGLAVGLVAFTWLVVLPRLADAPPVKRHIQTMKAAGIDPSAMYYTELEPHLFLQPQK